MTGRNFKAPIRLFTFCGQCQCGCVDLNFHAGNPPEQAFSLSNTDAHLGTIYCGEAFLRRLIAEAPNGAKGLIVHHPGNAPEQRYSISVNGVTLYFSADDRADLLQRASSGELQSILDRRQPLSV